MPGLARKLFICAAVDGLLLQPAGTRSADETFGLKIEYGTNKLSSTTARQESGNSKAAILETHGIVGLLNLISSSYIISITRCEQVAQIRGAPIYTIKDVTLIPLTSKSDAEKAIFGAQKLLKEQNVSTAEHTDESDAEEDSLNSTSGVTQDEESAVRQPEQDAAALQPPPGLFKKGTSIVQSVAQERGNIARYAQRWFRRGNVQTNDPGLTLEQERHANESLPEHDEVIATSTASEENRSIEDATKGSSPELSQKNSLESLAPRILRSARLYFSSSGFYFSPEHDLSRSLVRKQTNPPDSPLWRRFDTLFFWNRHLMKPFVDGGHDWLVLPILQGFVGQRTFSIARGAGMDKDAIAGAIFGAGDVIEKQNDERQPPEVTSESSDSVNLILTLISRRSVKRAGLRYLRRGVDDEGNAANTVETEQILSGQPWSDAEKTFSLVQMRGSIPLFFSQSPYSFKPLPVMIGSEGTNQAAFERHFDSVTRRYGHVQVASLVDKHGTEKSIGEAYEQHMKAMNGEDGTDREPVGFEWFDFHAVCKGMRFENVSNLLDLLRESLKAFSWSEVKDGQNSQLQTGILRTNCMDCLDRTNVVQSAVGGWALQQQLAELGLNIDLQTDQETQWFNTLWADNGDAISKQYAGTSALKGDFTRTRKRNWKGALSDFSLTLNRYYNNIFGDYFLQTCIDYYLGYADPSIFDEFETDMMAKDYALDMRQIRQGAIDTCVKIVLEDPTESLIASWTVSCPKEPNTLRTLPFEECVLLLTNSALYFCRIDWSTEKLASFERISLFQITEIVRGTYITSALGPTHLDEMKNVGFTLKYKTHGSQLVRRNTRTLANDQLDTSDEHERQPDSNEEDGDKPEPTSSEMRLLAFKVLPSRTTTVKADGEKVTEISEATIAKRICDEIEKTINVTFQREHGFQQLELHKPPQVQEGAIISASDAKRSTGYVESIGYSLKRLVWS